MDSPPKQIAVTQRIGPPSGNRNALRSGLYSGALPRGCSHIRRATDALRAGLEAAVLAARGEVNIQDAAAINTAVRAERLASLAQRWLRLNEAAMSFDQRLAHAREIVKASEARDRAIKELDLPRTSKQRLLNRLYGTKEAQ